MATERLNPRTVLLTALLLSIGFVGCRNRPASAPGPGGTSTAAPHHPHLDLKGEDRLAAMRGPRADAVRAEPELRIRVLRSAESARITGDANSPGNAPYRSGNPDGGLATLPAASAGSVTAGPGTADLGKARTYTFQAPLRISHDRQGFVITEPNGDTVRWRLGTIRVSSPSHRVTLGDDPYPGKLELVALRDAAGRFTGKFDAVNYVGMESYLPGVLSQELYPGWDLKAYRAQAIAARSYALWEMGLPVRRASHFDLEAGQASQAYIGAKASDKARTAVADTTGQVLVFEGRVLPAFYSSCSGGTGQDAVAAWPGKVDDLAPLRGRDHGGWGRQSTKFRWGPITRSRVELSQRLAAWGRANKHPVAALGVIASVQAAASNPVGRPTAFRVTDDFGKSYVLACEDLRSASNFRVSNLPPVTATNLVFSSHADYTVSGGTITITGRGFGHGVGMCQFGAQHMASEGTDHRAILGFYYPGAEVRKVY